MKKGSDVIEVKVIIDSLQFLEKQLPGAIYKWKEDIKTCNILANADLKIICENPTTLSTEIFPPLYSFLNTYIANREGRLAFTAKSLDTFLLQGLRAIKKFTVLTEFFSKNTQYFVPNIPIFQGGLEASKKAINEQNQYKDFILTLSERLVGCKEQLNFMFLKLLSTVKNMVPEMHNMKGYLEDQCRLMRIQRLNM